MYCTADQVRAANDKLTIEDISDSTIEDRIGEADKTIKVDLSGKYTSTVLDALDSSNKVVNLLSVWKSVELCLARLFGAARQVDQISDIDYWRKKYDALLQKILQDEIVLTSTSGTKNKPVITSATYRKKLFPTKGLANFEQGSVDDEY